LHLVSVGSGAGSAPANTSQNAAATKQQGGVGLSANADDEFADPVDAADPALGSSSAGNKQIKKSATRRQGSKPVFASKSHSSDFSHESRNLFHAFEGMVNSPYFEGVFAVIIVCSAIIMGVEMQYRGLDTGQQIGYRSYKTPPAETWPWALDFFIVSEWVLGILFTVELVLKVLVQWREFFCDFWNWIDVLIVSSWLLTVIFQSSEEFNPNILRILRLMRLLRLLKLLGMISVFDSLYLMTTAIKGSIYILVWAVLVLCVVEMSIACLLQASVENWLRDGKLEQKAAYEVYMHFGSFARSMLTMFELTLGNWIPPTRALVENISEWYLLFFLMHKFIIGFSVVSVITGVFIQETFKVATSDDQIMLNNKRRAMKEHKSKMQKLFEHADHDGDASLDRAEFEKVMGDRVVRKWLSSMGLEIDDVDVLFETLSGGDGKVTSDELVDGAGRLKGSARSIDLLMFITEYRHDRAVIMDKLQQAQLMPPTTIIHPEDVPSGSSGWCKVI